MTDDEYRVLCALPDPGAQMLGRVRGKRGVDLVREGLPAYPELSALEAAGLAESNRGWWRKTRAGVLHVRESV